MDSLLVRFLARHRAAYADRTAWSALQFERCFYLTAETPPDAYVTSLRCIIRRAESVLVMKNRDGEHLLPGGRREPGESPAETLRRELLEETGCTIASPRLLGLIHFHHLTPKPLDYPYPYPDFLQLVFTACALTHRAGAPILDDWELGSRLVAIERVRALPLHPAEFLFLDAALRARDES